MEEQTGPKTLAAAMAKVMGEVTRIAENGRNAHFGYDYVSDNDVYDAVRGLMAKNNIAVFASMKGQPQQDAKRTLVPFRFTLVSGETGEWMECDWWAEAQDNQDKGINKAATAALKYWLLKTFLISSGDPADDSDSGGDSSGKVTAQKPAGRAKAAPQAQSGTPPAKAASAPVDAVKDLAARTYPYGEVDKLRLWPDLCATNDKWTKVFWPAVKNGLGYADNAAVHTALGLNSVTDWDGTVGALWYALAEHSPLLGATEE